jgi:hypothetical protein
MGDPNPHGVKTAPDWLTTADLLKEYGGPSGYRAYLKEVRNGRRERPDDFEGVLFGGRRSSEMCIIKQDETPRELKPEDALNQISATSGARRAELFREVKMPCARSLPGGLCRARG